MTSDLPEGRDVSIPLQEIVMKATGLSLVLLVLPLLLFVAVWGISGLRTNFHWLSFVGILVLFVLAHEGFHAIGWKYWGNLRWQDLTFGFKWEALAPYCHARAPMRADAYRFGALLPGIMTGLLPFLMSVAVGSGMMAIISAIMISGAVGDVYVLWIMRDIPPDAYVLDHPENAGCIVVREGTKT